MEKYNYKSVSHETTKKIPNHWEIKRLYNICKIVRGNSKQKKNEFLS